jgi:tRNA nucleotidyltransferase (CCA-adding enzyme)
MVNAWRKNVLKEIVPSSKEAAAEQKMARSLIRKINGMNGPHLSAVLAGSLARNTHLRGDRDLDIFVFYSPTLKREKFEAAGLKLGHAVFGKNFHEEAYSEHPYVRGVIDGFTVEIVPTFKVDRAFNKISAVDRTPFHAAYMKKKLSSRQCNEVRLLKQFLKGVHVYGADVRFHGVPGYLVEILVLHYGTFEKAVENISHWREGAVIDLERAYGNENIALEQFNHPFLLVVDPTDASRNVAGALSYNQFARFIMACRAFGARPSETFFWGAHEKSLSVEQIKSFMKKEEFVGVRLPYPTGMLSDVMWGQLSRLATKLTNTLAQHDFHVLRAWTWTDALSEAYIIFEVENPILPQTLVRVGPKVVEEKHAEQFLQSHVKPVSGPRIEEGKLVVEIPRTFWQFKDALKHEVERAAHVESGDIKPSLYAATLVSEPLLLAHVKKDPSFASALSVFLKGKEPFLK